MIVYLLELVHMEQKTSIHFGSKTWVRPGTVLSETGREGLSLWEKRVFSDLREDA